MFDDVFEDEGMGDVSDSREVENNFQDIHKSGYRHGREAQESKSLQLGFDAGLEDGMRTGFEMGRIYAACRLKFLSAEEPLRTKLSPHITRLEDLVMTSVSRDTTADLLPKVIAIAIEFGVNAELVAKGK